jgi:hypothetical protein
VSSAYGSGHHSSGCVSPASRLHPFMLVSGARSAYSSLVPRPPCCSCSSSAPVEHRRLGMAHGHPVSTSSSSSIPCSLALAKGLSFIFCRVSTPMAASTHELAGRRSICSLLGLPGVLLPRLGAPASSFSLARFPARASPDADAASLTSSRHSIAAARHIANFPRHFSATTSSASASRARLVFGSSPRILRKKKL